MSNFVMTKNNKVCKNASHSACSSWGAANTVASCSNFNNITVADTVLAVSVFVFALIILLNINLIISINLICLAIISLLNKSKKAKLSLF